MIPFNILVSRAPCQSPISAEVSVSLIELYVNNTQHLIHDFTCSPVTVRLLKGCHDRENIQQTRVRARAESIVFECSAYGFSIQQCFIFKGMSALKFGPELFSGMDSIL